MRHVIKENSCMSALLYEACMQEELPVIKERKRFILTLKLYILLAFTYHITVFFFLFSLWSKPRSSLMGRAVYMLINNFTQIRQYYLH